MHFFTRDGKRNWLAIKKSIVLHIMFNLGDRVMWVQLFFHKIHG